MNGFDWLAAMRQADELNEQAPKYNSKNGSIHAFLHKDGRVELQITAPESSNCTYIWSRYEDLIPFARWVLDTFGEHQPAPVTPAPQEQRSGRRAWFSSRQAYGEANICSKCGEPYGDLRTCCSTALGGS